MKYRLTEDAWPDAQEAVNRASDKVNGRYRTKANPALCEQGRSDLANR